MINTSKADAELGPAAAIIDCNGLGMPMNISLNTYSAIQEKHL